MFQCRRANRNSLPSTHPPHMGMLGTTHFLSYMTRRTNLTAQTVYVRVYLFKVYTEVTAFCSWTLYMFGVLTVTRFFGILCCWRAGWGTKTGYVTSAQILVRFPSPRQQDRLNRSSGRFRCIDCFGGPMLCENCIVNQHTFNPFHRIQAHRAFFRLKLFADTCTGVDQHFLPKIQPAKRWTTGSTWPSPWGHVYESTTKYPPVYRVTHQWNTLG